MRDTPSSPVRARYGCLSWDLSLTEVLPLNLVCCTWYCLIWSCNISRFYSIRIAIIKMRQSWPSYLYNGNSFTGKTAPFIESVPFYPRPFWPTGIVIACVCVCVCVCLSVCQLLLVRTITRRPFKLGSPNLNQKMQNILLKVPIVFGAD